MTTDRIQRNGVFTFLFILLSVFVSHTSKSQEDILARRISLSNQRATIYSVLNQISDSIGFYFAYSSKDVPSDKVVRVNISNASLNDALNQILGDTLFRYKVFEGHILIQKKELSQKKASFTEGEQTPRNINIRGRVLDAGTHEPLQFATVGIPSIGMGNITNQDGTFNLKIPLDHSDATIHISHLGYKTKKLSAQLLSQQPIDIFLSTDYISIQEVFIRNIDPQTLVKEAVSRIPQFFSSHPMYLTAFYREGVLKSNKYQNYSEAVFRIYKASYSKAFDTDQVKLIKSRKIHNVEQADTLSIKLRGGISSSLVLDIAKNLPDFFNPETQEWFTYTRHDIVSIGDRTAYEIAFEQKKNISEPLFSGVIYIDTENLAILGSDFGFNQRWVSVISGRYVQKRNRKYIIKAESITYSVRYKEINGNYYISHVRGDLKFKYRKRRSLFYSPFHTFLELATTSIDTLNVKRFDRREIERTTSVFADEAHEFDENFWRDFNIIAPEESVLEMLNLINARIENMEF